MMGRRRDQMYRVRGRFIAYASNEKRYNKDIAQ